MPLYSVQTLYLTLTKGKPSKPHKACLKNPQLVEKRVVLFKARNVASAINKAEKEAIKYEKYVHINVFGQKVVTKYLGWIGWHLLFDEPAEGVEIFSLSEARSERQTERAILREALGKEYPLSQKKSREIRINFLDGELFPDPDRYINNKRREF